MCDPTEIQTTQLKLTYYYFILSVYLVQRPDDGLINNSKYVTCTSEECVRCVWQKT